MARSSRFRWLLSFDALVRFLSTKNLRSDWFGTMAAVLGVALGTATVNVVLVLDASTSLEEAAYWTMNPDLPVDSDTVSLRGVRADATPIRPEDAKEETHEDYEVMRSAVRLGSLSSYLVGALIVFFTFAVVVDRRKREIALLRSLGATRGQVTAIFVREALFVGLVGAALGFVVALPLAKIAAMAGITTTGRARIGQLAYPLDKMAFVSLVGAMTAMLGVVRPARDIFRLDVAETLAPRFLGRGSAHRGARKTRGVTLIALPFSLLVYALMRPFFQEALPSLTFFVIEAGLVCAAFLATILLVPDLVRRVGALLLRLFPRSPAAERLLTERRIEHQGDELGWSVSGIMLVFSLLLALHISTRALAKEIDVWASGAITPYAFLYGTGEGVSATPAADQLPPRIVRAHFTSRTAWPNAILAVPGDELRALAEAAGQPGAIDMARRLGPKTILLSKMMARRFRVHVGDFIDLDGRGGSARLRVVGITDDIGYVPMNGPYRNGKTYGVIDAADIALIAPYAEPLGSAVAVADPTDPHPEWIEMFGALDLPRGVRVVSGLQLEWQRKEGTARDFVIFDLILLLTTILAAVGMQNQMVLALHARRREIALYRALGMTTAQVRNMVLMEGTFVGLLGGGLAALLGVPLGYASIGALRAISAFEVAFDMPAWYVLATIGGALAVAWIATIHPALRASSADSAESIHYE